MENNQIPKFIYIHIPKTGGSSVKEIFNQTDYIKTIGHVHGLQQKLPIPTFTLVRNPYYRTLSAYNYLCTGGDGNEADLRDQKRFFEGFEPTIEHFHVFVKEKLKDIIWQQVHFLPLTYFCVFESNLLIDFAMKLEELDSSWKGLCDYLGIDTPLIKTNEGPKITNKEEWLTPEIKEIIYEIYQPDFINFQYEK